MRRSEQPQLTINKFKPLLEFDEVPIGQKVFRKNDQKRVHWEYTVFTIKGVIEDKLHLTDTNGKPVIMTGFELTYLYIMIQ